MLQHHADFFTDAFAADRVNVLLEVSDGLVSAGVDGEVKAGRETDGAKHAEMVFSEALTGIADGAKDPGVDIAPTSDEIMDDAHASGRFARRQGIEEEAIAGEVAALGIFLGASEADSVGMSAIGICAVLAEGGDFDVKLPLPNKNDPKGCPDLLATREKAEDIVGAGGGGNIVILGRSAHETIADAPSSPVSDESCPLEGLNDVKGERFR